MGWGLLLRNCGRQFKNIVGGLSIKANCEKMNLIHKIKKQQKRHEIQQKVHALALSKLSNEILYVTFEMQTTV